MGRSAEEVLKLLNGLSNYSGGDLDEKADAFQNVVDTEFMGVTRAIAGVEVVCND